MYKPLADSTLHSMTKKEIIELLRIAEHNAKVSQEQVEQQAENLKDWVPVVHGEWLLRHEGYGHYWKCSACHKNPCMYVTQNTNYCPNCGAKMDGGADND